MLIKTGILATACLIAALPGSVKAEMYETADRTIVLIRQRPDQASPALAAVAKGQVVVGRPDDKREWVKVSNPDGSDGYVSLKELKAKNIKPLKVVSLKEPQPGPEVTADQPDKLKVVQQALAGMTARANDLEKEKAKLKAELAAAQQGLASLKKEVVELIKSDTPELVTLSDKGSPVNFDGIGEVKVASKNGKTAIRVPVAMANSADKLFSSAKAERHMQGTHVYYIVDSALLAF